MRLAGRPGGITSLIRAPLWDVVGEHRYAAWREAAAAGADGPPVVVHRLDEITARAMGIRTGGAVLVRPDGVPARLWPGQVEPAPVLAAAVADAQWTHRSARAA